MFDFRVYNDEGVTLAVLEDSYSVRFSANDRFSSVIAKVKIDDEHIRSSASRHLHNEKKVGAYSQDIIAFVD